MSQRTFSSAITEDPVSIIGSLLDTMREARFWIGSARSAELTEDQDFCMDEAKGVLAYAAARTAAEALVARQCAADVQVGLAAMEALV